MAESAAVVVPIRKGDWFLTHSRVKFYPVDPRLEEINIHDIAHHLARIGRFCGSYDCDFYSVGQHSVLVADLVFEGLTGVALPARKLFALAALLHDASESYLNDIVSPLKHSPEMAGYREAEDRLQELIIKRFGLEGAEDAHGVIKAADYALLNAEADQLFKPRLEWAAEYPKSIVITPWTPSVAARVFMSRFCVYGGSK